MAKKEKDEAKKDDVVVEETTEKKAAGPTVEDTETPEESSKKEDNSEYVVAKGKALTTVRGIVGEGDKVSAEDFTHGEAIFKAFVKSGHIVSKGE